MEKCIVIGASHAGAQLVASLRQQGWTGAIDLIGDEPYLPYHRPPLSKAFLAEDKSIDELLIRPASAYEKAGITTHLGARVVAVDGQAKTVTLDDGRQLTGSQLVFATGGLARRLPIGGADLEGVCVLRDAHDVQLIKSRAKQGVRAVIIGGGYIGLETAASLTKLGMSVTVLEAENRLLARVTGPEISAFYQRIHQEEGVEILTSAMASQLIGQSSVEAVVLKDGRSVPADLVIVGVGISPDTALAEATGVEVDDGIVVNEDCQTSLDDIYAVGDCARQVHALYGKSLRIESVQNANDQAKCAAAAICGQPRPSAALPWFWSDQYDVKLQIAGLSQGFDTIVVRGDVSAGRSFTAFYFKGDALLACDAVNSPLEFMVTKKVLSGGGSIPVDVVANPAVDLRELLKPK